MLGFLYKLVPLFLLVYKKISANEKDIKTRDYKIKHSKINKS